MQLTVTGSFITGLYLSKKKKKKKSERELTASILKKDPEHSRDERDRFLIGQNMQIFEEVLFFKLSTTEKQKNKQTIHSDCVS